MSPVSLKKNIIASYFSQAYVVLAGILILPFYITEMGAEAYGLVGFFAMLQAGSGPGLINWRTISPGPGVLVGLT